MIETYDIALMALDADCAVAPTLTLVPHWISDPDAIHRAHQAIGYNIPAARLQQRINNKLRFVRFDVGDTPVATSWIVANARYLDELNWLLPIAAGETWLRDVYVAPAWRGRRVFANAITALKALKEDCPGRIWSDVDWDNAASLRAHQCAGFRVLARVRALDIGGRIRLRSSLPTWPLPITEIQTQSRWIWLRGPTLLRHRQLMA